MVHCLTLEWVISYGKVSIKINIFNVLHSNTVPEV